MKYRTFNKKMLKYLRPCAVFFGFGNLVPILALFFVFFMVVNHTHTVFAQERKPSRVIKEPGIAPAPTLDAAPIITPEVRTTAPAQPATINKAGETSAQKVSTGKDNTVTLNFAEADIKDIIQTVGAITGENFMLAPGVSGRITVRTSKPIPKKEVFAIFESILEVNGLAVVKSGSYYKIVQGPSAKQRAIELREGTEVSKIPEGDRIMTQIVPIEFISSNDIVPILQPMLSATGGIFNYTKTNTLIITDTASNIKKTLSLIKVFDVDDFKRMSIEIIPVENVDIKTLYKELTDMLGALGLVKDAKQLSVVPIERLNSLILLSLNNKLLESVKEWIRKLDTLSQTDKQSVTRFAGSTAIHIYYVQNDKAANIKTALDQIFLGKKSLAPVSKTLSSASGVAVSPNQTSTGGVMFEGSEGEIRIFLYEPFNGLIVQATEGDYHKILDIIKELDRSPKQVLIDALIVEVKLDETTKYGIQWSFLSGNTNTQLNTGIFSTTIDNPRGVISTPVGLDAPSGLALFSTDSSKFFSVIQAMAAEGRINVLSNPHIVVKNYEKATINIGSDEPIATQSTQTAVTGTSGLIQNIEYRKTGVILTVTPQITEGGMVAMSLRHEVSDKSTDRTVGVATYPSFTKREAETSVVAKDNETLVIGGLIQEKKDSTVSGIPLLKDIPLLGNLFKFTSNFVGKTELVILLTPRIIANTEQALSVTNEIKNKLIGLKELLNKNIGENLD